MSRTKQFTKLLNEFREQLAGIGFTLEWCKGQECTKQNLNEFRSSMHINLIKNSDPDALLTPSVLSVLRPLVLTDDKEIIGIVWKFIHQLYFLTMSNPTKANEFLRYADARRSLVYPEQADSSSPLTELAGGQMKTYIEMAKNALGSISPETIGAFSNLKDGTNLDEKQVTKMIGDIQDKLAKQMASTGVQLPQIDPTKIVEMTKNLMGTVMKNGELDVSKLGQEQPVASPVEEASKDLVPETNNNCTCPESASSGESLLNHICVD